MPHFRPILLTTLAMLAFAGNSLLCRAALVHTSIDAATFTSVRLLSGALVLLLLVRAKQGAFVNGGSWWSALALFAYAAGFSFAYVELSAATGALLLFGAVQASMIGYGLWQGERLRPLQMAGFILAVMGLVALLLPGLSTPPLVGSSLMIAAGVAWGIYSLRGKGAGDATVTTTGNFVRAVPMAAALSLVTLLNASLDSVGVGYAIASGALASGVGYAIWYSALPLLRATTAATVQLSVPVIAAFGGVFMLGEPISMRLALASLAILGGIALVIVRKTV